MSSPSAAMAPSAAASMRPSNVGIVASYLHFPETFVSQAALEKYDGAGEGKYQIGLGQVKTKINFFIGVHFFCWNLAHMEFYCY